MVHILYKPTKNIDLRLPEQSRTEMPALIISRPDSLDRKAFSQLSDDGFNQLSTGICQPARKSIILPGKRNVAVQTLHPDKPDKRATMVSINKTAAAPNKSTGNRHSLAQTQNS